MEETKLKLVRGHLDIFVVIFVVVIVVVVVDL